MAPPNDYTSAITSAHVAYAFLCNTAIIVKKIIHGASMTNNKHYDCEPSLN